MKKIYFHFLITAILLSGCTDADMFKDIHVSPVVSFPIGNVVTSDYDLFELADITMNVDSDGVLTFMDSTVLEIGSDVTIGEIITIPTQAFPINKDISAHVSGGAPGANTIIYLPDGIEDEFLFEGLGTGVDLDTVIYRSGSVVFNIEGLDVSGYDKNDLKIVVPSLQTVSDKQPVVLESGVPLKLSSKYMFVFGDENNLEVKFQGRVPFMTSLEGSIDIEGGDLNYVSGILGRSNIVDNMTQSISLGDFTEFSKNAEFVRFDRPEIVFELNNDYNAPMMVTIKALLVDDELVALKPGLEGQLIYVKPNAVTNLVISNSQTLGDMGLTNALTKDFKEIKIILSMIINPTAADFGVDPSELVIPTHNSITATDNVEALLVIKVPIDGVLDKVSFEHELEVDLEGMDSDEVEYETMTLSISGSNSLPLDMNIEVSIREPGSSVSIPLFDQPMTFPSSVNNLKPDDPGFIPGVVDESNIRFMSIPSDRIYLLLNADKLYLHLTASTLGAADKTSVKIYSPAELDLNIVLGAELDYVVNGE